MYKCMFVYDIWNQFRIHNFDGNIYIETLASVKYLLLG